MFLRFFLTGSDWRCVVVELSMQYFGHFLLNFRRLVLIFKRKQFSTYSIKMILKVDFCDQTHSLNIVETFYLYEKNKNLSTISIHSWSLLSIKLQKSKITFISQRWIIIKSLFIINANSYCIVSLSLLYDCIVVKLKNILLITRDRAKLNPLELE